jgi:hypothetical protein
MPEHRRDQLHPPDAVTAFAALIALLLAAALLLVLWWWAPPSSSQDPAYHTLERSRMPAELATARLVLSEKRLSTNRPFPLVARMDQVFLVHGRLVPVETKTRFLRQVYDADRIQLGVQAVVLRHAKHRLTAGYPVADYGYVRLVRPDGSVAYQHTHLPDEGQVLALANRRLALEQGRAVPQPAASPRLCRNCGQRPRCPNALA